MGILEKIADIEREIARTQKNKATEYHLGLLKAKLAKYRAELLEPKATSAKGQGFDVMKSGDARVAMIGFPSVGKSTLLSKLTNTQSEVGAYEFTTLTCIPGKIQHKGATIQLLDLPGIIEGAAQGKGRGRQVIAVARTADLVLMMLDMSKGDQQKLLLEKELESVGIRLNKSRPNIYFKAKTGGGITFNATVKLTFLNEKLVYHILHEYKIFNAEVLVREDATVDDFIDVVVGKRKYMPCLYVQREMKLTNPSAITRLTNQRSKKSIELPGCPTLLSSVAKWTLTWMVSWLLFGKSWPCLGSIQRNVESEYPDFDGGLIVRRNATVDHVCHCIHRSLSNDFKYALVWVKKCKVLIDSQGKSTKHQPQRVGLHHHIEDEDVIQIVKK